MKNFLKYSAVAAVAMVLTTGCTIKTSAGVSPVDISKIDMTKVETLKSGEACATRILGLWLTSDATAQTAAKNGEITTISYQEQSANTFLLFGNYCVKVYGK